jgi:hypothetical protein
VLYRQQVVRLPAADESAQWQTYTLWAFVLPGTASRTNLSDFLCRFLPQLVNVLCGQVRFVGVQPRSAQDLEQLPADRRALYLRTKAGLITEALVYYGQSPTEDELYSAEVFYAVTASASHDLKILCRYLVRLLHGGGGRGPRTV